MKTVTGALMIFLLLGQISSGQQPDKKEQREKAASRSFSATADVVSSGNFEFVADRTIPAGGSSISLTTNPNHLSFKGGEVDIWLPYFGIVYAGAGYNQEPGIRYTGKPGNYSAAIDEVTRRIRIAFEISNGSESHTMILSIGKKQYATLLVKSSGRSTITYDGYIRDTEL